ncbi:hypothetical protein JHN63_09440 [Streptomyces sp. MBT65]|uniref:hypothetical protein n=1 Tax=Streptomyces sp. MBT65 TaxID=1488395 RepID=UPI00190944EE|nr:hypothetical protein [Streptomyces sp. MBT65]MBK3574041.1 hypothetical protein [Streptomyces sp. MBT65]
MADERSAFPGDTDSAGGSAAGRTPGRWLNRETAELLLRGESLEAVDPAAREEAERLARTLGALSVEPSPAKVELPGEEAALAAFRAVRTGKGVERAVVGRRGRTPSSDAGLVRLGRPATAVPGPRWGRSMRFGLTAAVAVGMFGGVAVAVGTGALPTPFHDDPTPAASISAAETPPDRTLVSPAPSGSSDSGTPTAGGSDDSSGEAAGSGTNPTPSAGADDKSVGSGSWWRGVASSCRAVREGKPLAPGRKRALAGVAGGSSQVGPYCDKLLKRTGAGTDDSDDKNDQGSGGKDSGTGNGKSGGGQTGSGGQGGESEGQGHISPIAPGGGNNGGGGSGSGSGGGFDGSSAASPLPSVFAPLARRQSPSVPTPSHTTATGQTPAPSPTYSAL